MKKYSSILKIAALILSAIAVLCLVVASLDVIIGTAERICGKAKGRLCKRCYDEDYDEIWDDEDEYEEWGF